MGLDQGLFDGLQIPCSSRLVNCFRTAASLSGGNRRALDAMGGPLVRMQCDTAEVNLWNDGTVKLGNFSSSLKYLELPKTVVKRNDGPRTASPVEARSMVGSSIRRFRMSIKMPNLCKKSAPSIALSTSAIRNFQGHDIRKPRSTFNWMRPYVGISLPLAAYNVMWEGWDLLLSCTADLGKTDTAAPLSIKYRIPVTLSLMKRRLTPRPSSAVAVTDGSKSFP